MRSLTSLVLACSIIACGGAERSFSGAPRATPDAGDVDIDAGPVVTDAAAPDAGAASAPDAGAVPDAGAITADSGPAPTPDAGATAPPPPAGPSLGGCPMFPADSLWNREISGDPVEARSADYLAFMGADWMRLHPDFGAPEYGEPFIIVGGSGASAPMTFAFTGQSDPGPYPFPADLPIQAGADHHAAVLDKDHCRLYETYMTARSGPGFTADSGAIFDLRSGALRPDGWTSATASGLPMLPGLARYDEAVEQGEIRHALSFTAGATAHFYVHPATHSSGTSGSSSAPPFGMRVRLRAGYDLSGLHGASQVIARALQRYGMFLVDNATDSYWALAGAQDPRWPTQDLEQLKGVPASAFEVVQLGAPIQGQ